LRNEGLIPGRGKRYILFSIAFRPAMVPTELSMQWVQGAVSLGIKLQGCQSDISPSSSTEAKNGGDISPLPHTSSWHIAQLSIWITLPFRMVIKRVLYLKENIRYKCL
jgi:hypothetical protein